MSFDSHPRDLPCGVDCKSDADHEGLVESRKLPQTLTEAMSQYEFVHMLYFLTDKKVKAHDKCEVWVNFISFSGRKIMYSINALIRPSAHRAINNSFGFGPRKLVLQRRTT